MCVCVCVYVCTYRSGRDTVSTGVDQRPERRGAHSAVASPATIVRIYIYIYICI